MGGWCPGGWVCLTAEHQLKLPHGLLPRAGWGSNPGPRRALLVSSLQPGRTRGEVVPAPKAGVQPSFPLREQCVLPSAPVWLAGWLAWRKGGEGRRPGAIVSVPGSAGRKRKRGEGTCLLVLGPRRPPAWDPQCQAGCGAGGTPRTWAGHLGRGLGPSGRPPPRHTLQESGVSHSVADHGASGADARGPVGLPTCSWAGLGP